ncbi:hypothetical protein [uncultured Desulfobacter sp.]|uniref:hypothetical protein n=1 Tax=uncultured Desulfobacter sp. TaxID=240139 RepID=UPI002AAAD25E|nr:hypothetical protein [uncultured Desulfobacter sp.]
MKMMVVCIVSGLMAIAGCAGTPYNGVAEKRINTSLAKAEEFYNLGMYANAALAFEKVVRLAVVEQNAGLITQAQFRYALSLERCFADPALIRNAWDSAWHYARGYDTMTFDIALGWLNYRISFSDSRQAHEVDQALVRLQQDFPPKNILEKLQWLNLSGKWYMVQGMPHKAWDALDEAMKLVDGQDRNILENRDLAQAVSLTLYNRAMILVGRKDFENAMGLFNRSLALDRQNNNISGVYANLEAQAKLLDVKGETMRAETIREQLLQIRQYISNLSF